MDLYVERKYVEQMKQDDLQKILLFYDEYFDDLYEYVVRRVGGGMDAERIVRVTFLDALGQVPSTPEDLSYLVWLYSLARPRAWQHMSEASFPKKEGLISAVAPDEHVEVNEKIDRMFGKLSLEEREILRLKFFEQVGDGDVMFILGSEEASIGSKIYRVLKRAHFLVFGESDEKQGVYFGELSSMLERARESENFEIPASFRAVLRTELSTKLSQKDFAIDVEAVKEPLQGDVKEPPVAPVSSVEPEPVEPFTVKPGKPEVSEEPVKEESVGSNDPAKIFVQAVKEMKEEGEKSKEKLTESFEKWERFFDLFDKFKHIFAMIPIVLFVGVGGYVSVQLLNSDDKVARGYPTVCDIEVEYEGNFSSSEIRNINKGVSDRICDHFEVSRLLISRVETGKVEVEVDVPDWFLKYGFKQKLTDWRIKYYARTLNSNGKSGEVS